MKIPTPQLVRVSTQEQADNTSLADQRKEIKSYCIAMGHELVFEEVGSSKNTTDRPLFTKALETFRYRADGIIAAKLDRVAKNTRDVLESVYLLRSPANAKRLFRSMKWAKSAAAIPQTLEELNRPSPPDCVVLPMADREV